MWDKSPYDAPYPPTSFHFHDPVFGRLRASYVDVSFELNLMRQSTSINAHERFLRIITGRALAEYIIEISKREVQISTSAIGSSRRLTRIGHSCASCIPRATPLPFRVQVSSVSARRQMQ